MVRITGLDWERIGQALDEPYPTGRERLRQGLEALKDVVLDAGGGDCECANKVIDVLEIVDPEAAGQARRQKAQRG